MATDDDVEVLVSGNEPRRPARPRLRQVGWLAAGLLVVGFVAAQEDDQPRNQVTPPTVPPRSR